MALTISRAQVAQYQDKFEQLAPEQQRGYGQLRDNVIIARARKMATILNEGAIPTQLWDSKLYKGAFAGCLASIVGAPVALIMGIAAYIAHRKKEAVIREDVNQFTTEYCAYREISSERELQERAMRIAIIPTGAPPRDTIAPTAQERLAILATEQAKLLQAGVPLDQVATTIATKNEELSSGSDKLDMSLARHNQAIANFIAEQHDGALREAMAEQHIQNM